jgi:glycerol-3-phosphate cytidylyltransferase
MSDVVVYTAGAFDLLHIGHLRIIQNAAALGDTLVVGVSTDELIEQYKGVRPTIPYDERREIVASLKGVDLVVPQHTVDKFEVWQRLRFHRWVVGDDWYDSESYQEYRRRLADEGVETIFLPYTSGVSSTLRRKAFGV